MMVQGTEMYMTIANKGNAPEDPKHSDALAILP
jgi:hypothetical protein